MCSPERSRSGSPTEHSIRHQKQRTDFTTDWQNLEIPLFAYGQNFELAAPYYPNEESSKFEDTSLSIWAEFRAHNAPLSTPLTKRVQNLEMSLFAYGQNFEFLVPRCPVPYRGEVPEMLGQKFEGRCTRGPAKNLQNPISLVSGNRPKAVIFFFITSY